MCACATPAPPRLKTIVEREALALSQRAGRRARWSIGSCPRVARAHRFRAWHLTCRRLAFRSHPTEALIRRPLEQCLGRINKALRPAGVGHRRVKRPGGMTPARTHSSPTTVRSTGKPTSTSSSWAMSMALYLKNGSPAIGTPALSNHLRTSGCRPGSTWPNVSMVAKALMAAYGCEACSATLGSPSIRPPLV